MTSSDRRTLDVRSTPSAPESASINGNGNFPDRRRERTRSAARRTRMRRERALSTAKAAIHPVEFTIGSVEGAICLAEFAIHGAYIVRVRVEYGSRDRRFASRADQLIFMQVECPIEHVECAASLDRLYSLSNRRRAKAGSPSPKENSPRRVAAGCSYPARRTDYGLVSMQPVNSEFGFSPFGTGSCSEWP